MRRILVYGGLMLATLVAGLGVRYAPLGLPWVVMKYGGSMLWALMIYWVLCVALSRCEPLPIALAAAAIACALELSRLWHWAPLDAFRETTPGVLLLGKYFSLWNVVAYWMAIGLGAIVDGLWVRRWIGARVPAAVG